MTVELSIVVPTYGREAVLVRTLEALTKQLGASRELIVVDQTRAHEPETTLALERMAAMSIIRWIRPSVPSIPGAMNRGLLAAEGETVVFLDDDIEPGPDLVERHAAVHRGSAQPVIVAGQVLQPGEIAQELRGRAFTFCSSIAQEVDNFMGGNFSVGRHFAIGIGGFDKSFRGASYRFEAEFGARARRAGARIHFEPRATIRHLRELAGGTRALGGHLSTMRPHHAVGEYYYLLRCRPDGWLAALARRPLRAIRTRYHLKRPWRVPGSLMAELSGFLWAAGLAMRKPGLLGTDSTSQGPDR